MKPEDNSEKLMNKLKTKKQWLTFLYYGLGRQTCDMELCGLWLNKETDERVSTKWKKFSQMIFPLEPNEDADYRINQRQVLYNEVVLDIEEIETFKSIVEQIKKEDLYYMAWLSGSRGGHISLFFDRDLTEEERLEIIKSFNADEQKASLKTLIALENMPHWKTGNPKGLYSQNMFNGTFIGLNSLRTISIGNAKELQTFEIIKSEIVI